MKPRLLVLLTLLHLAVTSPNLEDNLLPTEDEILTQLMEQQRSRQGQPEVEASLGLPTDEESFNTLNALLDSFGTGARHLGGSGTHHFVSTSFPEMDARGFHESVFDSVGDYYPRWRRSSKRDPFGINSRGFHPDVFDQDLGKFNPMKRNYYRAMGIRKDDDDNQPHGKSPNRFKRESMSSDAADADDKQRITLIPVEVPPSHMWPVHVKNKSTSTSPEATKRRPGTGASGFHGDTFTSGFGDFGTMKREDRQSKLISQIQRLLSKTEHKRRQNEGSSGFHGDTFSGGFGDFDVMKRKLGMGSSGFHGDTFSGGFGDFDVMKKRKLGMGSSGFHGDTFSGGFGDFDVMKRKLGMGSSGFHGDTFSGGFGDFDVMKKRKLGMGSSGFHGDTFSGGFGDFDVMKRKLGMGSSGFHGDTFSGGFGDFDVMKRKLGMGSSGFHGDTFSGGFGDFDVMKRKIGMGSSGFHGDTFSGGFGDFDVMKRKNLEMSDTGFHSDTFNGGFGEFSPMRKRSSAVKKLVERSGPLQH